MSELAKTVNSNRIAWPVLLFYAVVVELVVGGAGTLLNVGGVSLRMLMFGMSLLLASLAFYLGKKLPRYVVSYLLFYTLTLLVGTLFGIANEADNTMLALDLKPLLFFYILPFFAFMIRTRGDVERVAAVIKYGAFGMAMLYIGYFILMRAGFLSWELIYEYMSRSSEFAFRETRGFFYKGFLYLCVGFFFAGWQNRWVSLLGRFVILLAIALTGTRGFLLATMLTFFFYYFVFDMRRNMSFYVLLFLCIVGAGFVALNWVAIFGDRTESNSLRLVQIVEVFERITPWHVLVGHGLGIGVPIRPGHMEISYLEIFHKQGVIGLVFWLGLLLGIMSRFAAASARGLRQLATPFLLGTLVVFVQSFTNPFMNNPIGLSAILISLVCLDVLAKPVVDMGTRRDK